MNFMEIKKGSNMFYVGESEENPLAKVELESDEKDNIVIEHTIVSDELKGQNVAKQLIKKVVDFAREENKKIVPVCTYAQAQFEKNKEYEDVLYK